MIKILCYETKRLLFSKIYAALLALTLAFAYYVLSTQTILGAAYTAPFSQWSFSSFVCRVVPFLMVFVLFFCTYVYSKKEMAVRAITLTTPLSVPQYYFSRIVAIAVAYLITVVLVLGLSFGFYAVVFRFYNFADFVRPVLLFLVAPSIFLLGLGMAGGALSNGLQYVLILLTFLLGMWDVAPLGAAGLFSKAFVDTYPLQLLADASGEVPFLIPAGLTASRYVWGALGLALLGLVCFGRRQKYERS